MFYQYINNVHSLTLPLVPGTTIYFGTYEYTKRTLTAAGCPDTLAHLAGGNYKGALIVQFKLLRKNYHINLFVIDIDHHLPYRINRRLLCVVHLCAFRSAQDKDAAPGAIQQPVVY